MIGGVNDGAAARGEVGNMLKVIFTHCERNGVPLIRPCLFCSAPTVRIVAVHINKPTVIPIPGADNSERAMAYACCDACWHGIQNAKPSLREVQRDGGFTWARIPDVIARHALLQGQTAAAGGGTALHVGAVVPKGARSYCHFCTEPTSDAILAQRDLSLAREGTIRAVYCDDRCWQAIRNPRTNPESVLPSLRA
ncbi:MAG: hypothetical protein Q8S13_09940 [Dehalococcoidia bacterium]|nr:hypothetical protein [Dehalococcoidia bacterium]